MVLNVKHYLGLGLENKEWINPIDPMVSFSGILNISYVEGL